MHVSCSRHAWGCMYYECVYACICVARHALMYEWMFLCKYVYIHVGKCVCFMYICTFVWVYMWMYVGRQAWMTVCMSVSAMHEFPCMVIWMYVARHVRAYTFLFPCMWIHFNKQCDQKYWYTYISHYWHMPCTTMCATLYMSAQCLSTVLYT